MANPVKLSAGKAYKLTQRINTPDGGFSESYTFCLEGDFASEFASLTPLAIEMANERRKLLHNSCRLISWKLSQEGVAGDSLPRRGSRYGCGAGAVSSPAADYTDAVYLQFRDVSSRFHSERAYAALAYEDLVIDTDADRGRPGFSERVDKWMEFLKLKLTKNLATGGGQVIRAGLPSYDRDTAAAQKLAVKTWARSASGFLQVTVAMPAAEYVLGTRIKVTHKRNRLIVGLNGTATITDRTEAGGLATLLLDRRCEYPTEMLARLSGTVQTRAPGYYQIGDISLSVYGDRKIGRRFFQRVGRRSNRSR